MTNVIDLDALAYAETGECKIKHPVTGAVLGTIVSASPKSRQVVEYDDAVWAAEQAEEREYQRARVDAAIAGTTEPINPKDKRTPAEWRERMFKRLAAHVISADFSVKIDGKDKPFTKETAFLVFSEPRHDWLTVQFSEYVAKNENFMPNSAVA